MQRGLAILVPRAGIRPSIQECGDNTGILVGPSRIMQGGLAILVPRAGIRPSIPGVRR